MPAYSLAQAAQACGVNRSTVLRAIKSGRITGTKDELGQWHVEPVELHRIFAPAEATPKAVPQHAQPDAELRLRAELAEQRLSDLKTALDDMRGQRDHWQEIASRLVLADSSRSRPWWRRLAGSR
jgi:hypothetical protein